MRIYFHLTPNREPVPFNYQPALVGAFHQWLGENELHDEISLYSLSWLSHGQVRRGALDFPGGSTFQISAPGQDLLAQLITGIKTGWHIRWGMEVDSITLQRTPDFGDNHRFITQSPVLVKRRIEEGKHKYFLPGEEMTNEYLTQTLQHKLARASMPQDVQVSFDSTFPNPKTKLINYKGINIRATACPVIVSGDPRAVAFAWEVGVGNSTGIGFGALR